MFLCSVPLHTAGAPPPHTAPVHLWHILYLPKLTVVLPGCPREPYTDQSQPLSPGSTLIPDSLVLTFSLHQRGTNPGWAPVGKQDGHSGHFGTSLRPAVAVSGFLQISFMSSKCPSGSNYILCVTRGEPWLVCSFYGCLFRYLFPSIHTTCKNLQVEKQASHSGLCYPWAHSFVKVQFTWCRLAPCTWQQNCMSPFCH